MTPPSKLSTEMTLFMLPRAETFKVERDKFEAKCTKSGDQLIPEVQFNEARQFVRWNLNPGEVSLMVTNTQHA